MKPGKIKLSKEGKCLKQALHSQLLIYVPFEFDRINLNKQQDGRLNVSCYDGFFWRFNIVVGTPRDKEYSNLNTMLSKKKRST